MKPEYVSSIFNRIVHELGQRDQNAFPKVIRHLQSMKDRYMQSGDDTVLENVWAEICVQVQGQESIFFDAYIDTIEGIVLGFLDDVNVVAKQVMWLQTPSAKNGSSIAKTIIRSRCRNKTSQSTSFTNTFCLPQPITATNGFRSISNASSTEGPT
jgi:hypothetical protein